MKNARSRGLYARVQIPKKNSLFDLERGHKAHGYVPEPK